MLVVFGSLDVLDDGRHKNGIQMFLYLSKKWNKNGLSIWYHEEKIVQGYTEARKMPSLIVNLGRGTGEINLVTAMNALV